MRGDFGEERIGRLHRIPERVIHPDEVAGQRREVAGQFLGSGRP
jgi:hypothetical protein